MTTTMNNETSTYILIIWIAGSDGSISFNEEKTIFRSLDILGYTDQDNYRKLESEIGAMSTKNLDALIGEAIEYAKKNYSNDKKRLLYLAIENIASSDGSINRHERQRLSILREQFEI